MIRVKRKTLVKISRVLFAITICILGVLAVRTLLERWKAETVSQHPRQSLGIVIDLGQREKLFEQLRRFAESHEFDIHIGPTTPAGDTFNIYMSRKDVIVWGDNVLNPRGYDFDFYDKDPDDPASRAVLDGLMNDLKTYIGEVPNVRIFD